MEAQPDHTPLTFTKLTFEDVNTHVGFLIFPKGSTVLVRQATATVYRFIQTFETNPSQQLALFNMVKRTLWSLM